MRKIYSSKVYSVDNTFKFTINPKDLKSEISFSSVLNSGQGEMSLVFNKPVDYVDIVNTDIVKVYVIDTDNPDGRIIYTGIVQDVIRDISSKSQQVTLPLLGLGSIFTYKTFNGNKNTDPGTIISDFVDSINIDYNIFTKDIDTYGTDIDIDFDYQTLSQGIKQAKEATDMNYNIEPSGLVTFKALPVAATHEMNVGKEVQKIRIEEDTETLVNHLFLEWNGGTQPYSDATSKTSYGLREKRISDTSIKDIASANEFGNNYITKNKDPILKTTLEVNPEYDIESVKPGDTITINHPSYTIENKLIVKVTYRKDGLTLNLEDFESFGSQFL